MVTYKVASMSVALALGALATFPASAQKLPVSIATQCPIPYSVADQIKGGELAAKFGAAALSKLAKVPEIEAKGGLQIVKSAYAGVTSQAMSSVLEAYGCRINAYLDKTAPTDKVAKVEAVENAIARLELEMAGIQSAAEEGSAALKAIKDEYLANDKRAANAPVLDFAITSAALADVDPTALFISTTVKEGWLGLKVGPYVDVSACGGVVEAAISDGSSSLQKSLSEAKAILINYLDPKKPPYIGLSKLFVSVAVSPIKKATADNVSFKGCSAGIAAKPASAPGPAIAPDPVAPATNVITPALQATPPASPAPTAKPEVPPHA